MLIKNRLSRKYYTSHSNALERRHSSSSQDNVDTRCSSTRNSQEVCQKKQLRNCHHNARRTRIHLILDRKANGIKAPPHKRQRRFSYFLMSQEYKRKMSDALQIPEQEQTMRRKISWSEDCQFVTFNKNKSCQAIRQAPRHKFSIDE